MSSLEEKRSALDREKALADALLTACQLGLLTEVTALLASGATFDCADKLGTRPLCLAAAHGHAEIVALMCNHGVDVDEDDSLGRTALHHAAMHDRSNVVRCLCERGAWTEAVDHEDATPLLLAARMAGVDTVRALVSAGANVKAMNTLGMTPLCEALVVRQRLDVAEALVEAAGCRPLEERVRGGCTLLHVAAAMNKTAAVRWLLARARDEREHPKEGEGSVVGVRAPGKRTPASGGDDTGAPGGMTPLHCAAATGAAAAAAALLSGIDASGIDASGIDAAGDAAADVMAAAARDASLPLTDEERAACERVAKDMKRAEMKRAGGSAVRRAAVVGRAAKGVTFASLPRDEQAKAVRRWATVAADARAAERVPVAAWKALDAHAAVAREVELRDFLMKLIDDDDFQEDMRVAEVKRAVEEVVEDFHNVTKWRTNPRVMSVLDKFRHVQRFCKDRGHKITFADVQIATASEAEERRAHVGRLRKSAEVALERAREAAEEADEATRPRPVEQNAAADVAREKVSRGAATGDADPEDNPSSRADATWADIFSRACTQVLQQMVVMAVCYFITTRVFNLSLPVPWRSRAMNGGEPGASTSADGVGSSSGEL